MPTDNEDGDSWPQKSAKFETVPVCLGGAENKPLTLTLPVWRGEGITPHWWKGLGGDGRKNNPERFDKHVAFKYGRKRMQR